MTSCSCLEMVRRQKRRGSWLRSKMAASTNEAAERWAAERWAGPAVSGPCCSACLRYSANDLGSSPVGACGCARGVWSMFSSWSRQSTVLGGRGGETNEGWYACQGRLSRGCGVPWHARSWRRSSCECGSAGGGSGWVGWVGRSSGLLMDEGGGTDGERGRNGLKKGRPAGERNGWGLGLTRFRGSPASAPGSVLRHTLRGRDEEFSLSQP